ncbi:TPA: hypothetical protein DIV48_00570 [Candidatus Kaiserbacteria bacterium]|nr:MAG: hypothetical protein UY93_C0002G0425 [Parcubacteria group bacterium GW2011_GWA1_56_13]KKW45679.1 MAG: hypothetical protein UY97_C0017G0009 [Parcubacteria group bacterium GW2011_GWB1_57_6]HCR52125.1 hypothetical protein [Candidatus Kaiserbacteria bacterium]
MNNLTVLYYSANAEEPAFEAKIRENLLKHKGNLPLVSVTQEPAPGFGENICVGRHHPCYGNEFRQIQIGLDAVKTDYVITAEADVLYPPAYFAFRPDGADYYRYGNVWLAYIRPKTASEPDLAFFKRYSDGAQVIRKDFWRLYIGQVFGKEMRWYTEEDKPSNRAYHLGTDPKFVWTSDEPVITFKTLNNVSRYSSHSRRHPPRESLPFWGDLTLLRASLSL